MRIFGTRDVDGRGELKPVAGWRLPASESERIISDPKETRGLRIVAWVLVLVGMFVGYYARDAKDDMSLFVIQFKSLFTVVIAEAGLLFLYRRMRDYIWMGRGLKRIQARVPDEHAVAIRYTIRTEGVVTGADEGYVWLHDGTLYFKGLQSVWRLNRDDMPPVPMWPRSKRPRLKDGRPPTWLPMPHLGIKGEMLLAPIDPYEDYAARRKFAEFFAALDEWLRSTPQGHIESLLPPSDLHPSLSSPRSLEAISAPYLLGILNQTMIFFNRTSGHNGQFGGMADGVVASVYFALFASTSWYALKSSESNRVRIKLLRQKRIDSVLYP